MHVTIHPYVDTSNEQQFEQAFEMAKIKLWPKHPSHMSENPEKAFIVFVALSVVKQMWKLFALIASERMK